MEQEVVYLGPQGVNGFPDYNSVVDQNAQHHDEGKSETRLMDAPITLFFLPHDEMGNLRVTHTAKDGRKNKERTKTQEGVLERHFLYHLQTSLQVVGAVLPHGHADPPG